MQNLKRGLTDPVMRNLKEGVYWDTKLPGFGIRVSPKGLKTFQVLADSGRRKALGHYPRVSLADARKAADKLLAEKTLGKVHPTHTAFEDAVSDFLRTPGRKHRTTSDYTRLLKRLPFGRKSIADITPHAILRHLEILNQTPSEKHHVFAASRAFFRWAKRQHLIEQNPMEDMFVLPASKPRERTLTDAELSKVLKLALTRQSLFHSIVALLVLTGQRRGEIAALEWSWITDGIALPSSLTKNGRAHRFPVGPMTLDVIASIPRMSEKYLFPAGRNRSKDKPATVFNGWGKPKAAFDKELQIAPWTLHDLRRTFRTKWAELGISREIAERYINHVSGVHSGIVAVYDRHTYYPEMKRAVATWEQYLQNLIAWA